MTVIGDGSRWPRSSIYWPLAVSRITRLCCALPCLDTYCRNRERLAEIARNTVP